MPYCHSEAEPKNLLSKAKDLLLVFEDGAAVKEFYVYIMASRSRTLYASVTNDLARRVYEHKNKPLPGFTARYNINRLVWYEQTEDVLAAITREKEIKGWLRAKKIALIESVNPAWDDLSEEWHDE